MTTVHIEDEIHDKLRDIAHDKRTSIRAVLDAILRKALRIGRGK